MDRLQGVHGLLLFVNEILALLLHAIAVDGLLVLLRFEVSSCISVVHNVFDLSNSQTTWHRGDVRRFLFYNIQVSLSRLLLVTVASFRLLQGLLLQQRRRKESLREVGQSLVLVNIKRVASTVGRGVEHLLGSFRARSNEPEDCKSIFHF